MACSLRPRTPPSSLHFVGTLIFRILYDLVVLALLLCFDFDGTVQLFVIVLDVRVQGLELQFNGFKLQLGCFNFGVGFLSFFLGVLTLALASPTFRITVARPFILSTRWVFSGDFQKKDRLPPLRLVGNEGCLSVAYHHH